MSTFLCVFFLCVSVYYSHSNRGIVVHPLAMWNLVPMYRSSSDPSSKWSIPMLVPFEYLNQINKYTCTWCHNSTVVQQICMDATWSRWKIDKCEIVRTWLNDSNIEHFVHLVIVGRHMEYAFRWVLYTCNTDRNQIFRDLLPFNCPRITCRYMKYLRP